MGAVSIAGDRGPARSDEKDQYDEEGSAGEEMAATGGSRGRGEEDEAPRERDDVDVCWWEWPSLARDRDLAPLALAAAPLLEWPSSLPDAEDDASSREGDVFVGGREKDCSKGLGSRSKSERFCALLGRISGEEGGCFWALCFLSSFAVVVVVIAGKQSAAWSRALALLGENR